MCGIVMKKNVLSHYDVAERQQKLLNHFLTSPADELSTVGVVNSQVAKESITLPLEMQVDRNKTRVLFISRDESVTGGVFSIDGYIDLSELFDEVHIILLRTSSLPVRFPVLRVATKVWLYVANAKYWWQTPFKALSVIADNLAFADGFRPDIIIAHDPFESTLVATIASTRYNRPFQVHILEDFYQSEFLVTNDHPRLRRWLAKYLLRNTKSIRVPTKQISQMVQRRFPAVSDVATLPRFNKYATVLTESITYDVKQIYPDFALTILYIGTLNYDNLAQLVIDGISPLCEALNIGLIIIGTGPAQTELKKRVQQLKLERYVVFETSSSRQNDYLKTADILVVTSTTSAADELVIKGAALGIGLLATPTPVRTDLFTNNSSILFLPIKRSLAISNCLKTLAEDRAKLIQLMKSAQQIIFEKLYTNPIEYQYEYRKSIEQVLFIDDDKIELN